MLCADHIGVTNETVVRYELYVRGEWIHKIYSHTFSHTHSSKKDMNEYRELTDSHDTELFYTVVVHTALNCYRNLSKTVSEAY